MLEFIPTLLTLTADFATFFLAGGAFCWRFENRPTFVRVDYVCWNCRSLRSLRLAAGLLSFASSFIPTLLTLTADLSCGKHSPVVANFATRLAQRFFPLGGACRFVGGLKTALLYCRSHIPLNIFVFTTCNVLIQTLLVHIGSGYGKDWLVKASRHKITKFRNKVFNDAVEHFDFSRKRIN